MKYNLIFNLFKCYLPIINILSMTSIILKKDTIQRIVKDVKDIITEPLYENGIYYEHDDEDMLKGYAMLIGQQNTQYEHGMFFFEFIFPINYPYSPPKLNFITNNSATRFNPNLYRDGKVCLSVLNTWRGEAWSSCQSIRSILNILQTVLNDKPLLNEPGIKETHSDFNKYNSIIQYESYNHCLYKQLNYNKPKYMFDKFGDIVMYYFLINYKTILKSIDNEHLNIKSTYKYPPSPRVINTGIYTMKCKLDYSTLINNIKNLYIKLNTKKNIELFNNTDKYRAMFKDIKL